MRRLVKRILPKRAYLLVIKMRRRMDLSVEFRGDRDRYARHYLPGEVCRALVGSKNLEAQLTKDYHRIEKGLALPLPKRPFGAAVKDRLEGNIPLGRLAGTSQSVMTLAEGAHQALLLWNEDGVISDEVAPVASEGDRGISDAEAFFRSRHSVRDYEPTAVPDEILAQAVKLALRSPSVCNRQAWMIRFFRDDDVPRVLSYQNGNSGFTDAIPVVALVSVDTRLFSAPGERNQPWIEGGIFASTLVWALHALGLDSCMLNMSVRNKQADALRGDFGLADCELVVMMIAIGRGRDGHRVARSPRRPLGEVVIPT